MFKHLKKCSNNIDLEQSFNPEILGCFDNSSLKNITIFSYFQYLSYVSSLFPFSPLKIPVNQLHLIIMLITKWKFVL